VLLEEHKSGTVTNPSTPIGSAYSSVGGGLDLKYLLFRLDFNEYYHEKAIKEEEHKKR
jgi:hypothetical protein